MNRYLTPEEQVRRLSDYDLGIQIADNGGWEEFHQKRHEYTMYDYHKARRLLLEREYRRRHP